MPFVTGAFKGGANIRDAIGAELAPYDGIFGESITEVHFKFCRRPLSQGSYILYSQFAARGSPRAATAVRSASAGLLPAPIAASRADSKCSLISARTCAADVRDKSWV